MTLFNPKNRIELDSVRKELIGMKEDEVIDLMDYVCDKPYMHLDIYTASGELRKNFKLLNIMQHRVLQRCTAGGKH